MQTGKGEMRETKRMGQGLEGVITVLDNHDIYEVSE